MTAHPLQGRPVILGELLWDHFADGSRTLGGAPFNVAWHLQGFGLQPVLISRVGPDALGNEALTKIESWGMDTRGVQRDAQRATGTVHVVLRQGQPDFDIVVDRAFDYIDAAAALKALEGVPASLLYHGSLVARAGTSRDTLAKLRQSTRLPTFVDVNLRAPWWDHALLWQVLRGARWVKMSHDELRNVNEEPLLRDVPLPELTKAVRSQFDFELLIASQGGQGTYFVSVDDSHWVAAPAVEHLSDTVGAGDALSAVVILGLQRGWSRTLIQQRATEFAGQVCSVHGAIVPDQNVYEHFLSRWK